MNPFSKSSPLVVFQGTVVWGFLSKEFQQKYPTDPFIRDLKQFRIQIQIRLKKIDFKIFTLYRRLQQILLCAMGHYGEFGCALWATAVDLVTRYGPLWQICLCAMGHCAE